MCEKRNTEKKEAEKKIRGKTTVLSFGDGLQMKLFDIPDDYVPPGKPEHPDIILPDAWAPPAKQPEPNQEHPDQD